MRIQEAANAAGLTKKAVIYYTEQGLVMPVLLENGYRDYGDEDVARLRKIAVLRRLDLGTGEIRAVLDDPSGAILRRLSVKELLAEERRRVKESLLAELGQGGSYDAAAKRLAALEDGGTVAEALLAAFPGDFGRFISLHFARFLTEPIETEEQRAAFDAVLRYLDALLPLNFPEEVRVCLEESVGQMDAQDIRAVQAQVQASLATPHAFLEEQGETVKWYLAYRQTEEYRSSAAGQLQSLLRQFQAANGYEEIFLPAMRRLSPAYDSYCRQLEAANAVLMDQYPQAEEL